MPISNVTFEPGTRNNWHKHPGGQFLLVTGGKGYYTEEDCRWVEFIKCMRNVGLPVEVLIEYVTLFQQGDETVEARKELLVEQREQLITRVEDMKKTLERLNYIIARYKQELVEKEKALRRSRD